MPWLTFFVIEAGVVLVAERGVHPREKTVKRGRRRMRVLGVNGSGRTLWLAVVGGVGPEDTEPSSLILGNGAEAGFAMSAFQQEARHLLARLRPQLVVVLDPETNARTQWKAAVQRVTAESLLALAAGSEGIGVNRITRASVKSNLGLGQKGGLADHAKEIYPDSVGTYWAGRRDIAALAAKSRLSVT